MSKLENTFTWKKSGGGGDTPTLAGNNKFVGINTFTQALKLGTMGHYIAETNEGFAFWEPDGPAARRLVVLTCAPPIIDIDVATKKYVDDAVKLDISQSVRTLSNITVGGKKVYIQNLRWTSTGTKFIEQEKNVDGIFSSDVIRKKNDGAWILVSGSDLENEIAINAERDLQINITAKEGWTSEIKCNISYITDESI